MLELLFPTLSSLPCSMSAQAIRDTLPEIHKAEVKYGAIFLCSKGWGRELGTQAHHLTWLMGAKWGPQHSAPIGSFLSFSNFQARCTFFLLDKGHHHLLQDGLVIRGGGLEAGSDQYTS